MASAILEVVIGRILYLTNTDTLFLEFAVTRDLWSFLNVIES